MGLFDFMKKDKQVINWEVMAYPEGATIEYIIKRFILDNRHACGCIEIEDKSFDFQYGNLGDIVPSSTLTKFAAQLYKSERDNGEIWYKIDVKQD